MGQCIPRSRKRHPKTSLRPKTLRIPNNYASQSKWHGGNLSAGDLGISSKTHFREIGFQELFDDELKVLNGLADLESELLKNEPVSLKKDDLIYLLRQESEGLTKVEGETARKDLQVPINRESMTSIDELLVVTGLLFRLQGHGSTESTNNNKTLETSTDSGLAEDSGTSVASVSESGIHLTTENKVKPETSEKVLELSALWGRKAILQNFLDDVGNYGNAMDENDSDTYPKSSPVTLATSISRRRKDTSQPLFDTASLLEDLKLHSVPLRNSVCGCNRFPCYPVRYNFWAPTDDDLGKYFSNRQDRRILSICRLSHCRIQLNSPVRKNANGISVQQISIQAPSLGALKRCCSILDDVFPHFNASNPLKGPVSEDGSQQNLKSIDNEEETERSSSMDVESHPGPTANEAETLPQS